MVTASSRYMALNQLRISLAVLDPMLGTTVPDDVATGVSQQQPETNHSLFNMLYVKWP